MNTEGTQRDGSPVLTEIKETGEPSLCLLYNSQTETFIKNPKGLNYVVLNGNFNDSVKLAEQYASGDGKAFGKYNFVYHNCSDYTDMILSAADIDGMLSQVFSERNPQVSIPALREIELSVTNTIDSSRKWISNWLIDVGESIDDSTFWSNSARNMFTFTGESIDFITNVTGDITDNFMAYRNSYSTAKKGMFSYITNKLFG